jgi:hypothetical protein
VFLAERGWNVVMLEKGGFFRAEDFSQREEEAMAAFNGGAASIRQPTIPCSSTTRKLWAGARSTTGVIPSARRTIDSCAGAMSAASIG